MNNLTINKVAMVTIALLIPWIIIYVYALVRKITNETIFVPGCYLVALSFILTFAACIFIQDFRQFTK